MTKNNCCVQNESNSSEHKQKTPLFYRLIHNEWVETVKNLTGAEIKVLYYLRSLDPFGVKRSSPKVSPSRIQYYGNGYRTKHLQRSSIKSSQKIRPNWFALINKLSRVKIKITTDQYKDTEFPIGNEQQPEALPDGDLRTPQTIKTYSDFIKTLSDYDRASFLNFCQEKTKSLSQEVIDLEAWLASKTKAGENRWEVQYRLYKASQSYKNQEELSRIQARDQVKKWKRELEEQTYAATVACKELLIQEKAYQHNDSSS